MNRTKSEQGSLPTRGLLESEDKWESREYYLWLEGTHIVPLRHHGVDIIPRQRYKVAVLSSLMSFNEKFFSLGDKRGLGNLRDSWCIFGTFHLRCCQPNVF